MKNLHIKAIAMAVALAPAALHAQNYVAVTAEDNSDPVIYETGAFEIVTTGNELGELLDRVRPVEPNSIPRPKFAIRSKNNRFILSIGGKINPVVGYDIGNDLYDVNNAGMSFIPGSIPVPPQPAHRGSFFINPLNAYLDFTIVGLANTENQVTGYVKLATNHNSKGIILKRAYVSWRYFTAGMVATLMEDGIATGISTIDPQGPCGKLSNTAYQVSYKSKSYDGFSFGLGIEMPTFYSSSGVYMGKDFRHEFGGVSVTSEASTKAPDVPAYIEYAASKQNRIRLSGLLRNFFYRDLLAGKDRYIPAWGASLSGNFSFYKPLTFSFQGAYGKGIANYLQDISGRELSFTPRDSKPGQMVANPMMGLVFGASYNATPKLQFNAIGSFSRIWKVGEYATLSETDGIAGNNNYKSAVYVAANCFYNFTPYLQIGIEYLYGRRQTWNMGGANDNRIETQFQFTF